MTATDRRVAVTRKLSLADFGDDLQDSYVIVTLADFEEVSAISELEFEKMTNLEATKEMLEIGKKHFVAGKIALLNEVGESELVDMKPDDIQASAAIIGGIYGAVMGVIPDPKVTSTTMETSPTPSHSNEPSATGSSMKTTLSTETNSSLQA